MSEAEMLLNKAIDLANQIEAVVRGQDTVAVFIAFGKIIGAAAADAERPDIRGLMYLIGNIAHVELSRRRSHPSPHPNP